MISHSNLNYYLKSANIYHLKKWTIKSAMPHYKNLNNFIKNNQKNTLFSSHATHFVKKIKHSKIKSSWVLKEILPPTRNPTTEILKRAESEAIEETVAQEFFRLLYPASPKTRWAKETRQGPDRYCVLSKEVEGFDSSFLSNPNLYNAIEDGSMRGFSTVLLIALLLREADLNNNNIAIDAKGNIVKIDGGLCFAHLKENHFALFNIKKINFTHADIESLPGLCTYRPFNWVDLTMWKKGKSTQENPSTALHPPKKAPPRFKQELYKTITLICLLPHDLIYSFTAVYSPDPKKAQSLAIDIIKQIKKLENIAAQMPDFLEYRTSIKAEQDIIDYTLYLKTFNTMGKSNLLDKTKHTSHIDVLDIIFTRSIKNYLPIKNLYHQLEHIQNLSNPNVNALIEPLKNEIAVCLTCPSYLNRQIVYKMLCDTRDKMLSLNSAKRTLTTFSINSLIHHLKHLENITCTSRNRSHAIAEDSSPTGAKKRKTINFSDSINTANDSQENLPLLKKHLIN
ncbi:uncharacterized protein RVIR1_06440 [Candidatus Rickettsiella viridis]|uniref:Uncharacterized protein n=1 Tax=Candidatus Rickettsiella viridis TaxID=676208 RepID=A0A2Z5V3X0_9COXI|nr:hypothetical protein [Candidatus Rickettsiella viridis]BBB15142.1 uncharacterized protein RVIR1_06440 [Candidatus Rickettsiella viridis]